MTSPVKVKTRGNETCSFSSKATFCFQSAWIDQQCELWPSFYCCICTDRTRLVTASSSRPVEPRGVCSSLRLWAVTVDTWPVWEDWLQAPTLPTSMRSRLTSEICRWHIPRSWEGFQPLAVNITDTFCLIYSHRPMLNTWLRKWRPAFKEDSCSGTTKPTSITLSAYGLWLFWSCFLHLCVIFKLLV